MTDNVIPSELVASDRSKSTVSARKCTAAHPYSLYSSVDMVFPGWATHPIWNREIQREREYFKLVRMDFDVEFIERKK